MDLQGKVIIITGASSGIGEAVARELVGAGMKAVLAGRRTDRLKPLCEELIGAVCLSSDITDPDTPMRLLDMAVDAFGCCDVVFNNAGILEAAPIDKIDIDRVCGMVRTNVEAAFRMAYVAMKYFVSNKSGHLINTSSVLGTKVRPGAGAYAGTKYAIEALSEALRMEVAGTDVQVSVIEPGLVMTELHDHWETPPAEALNIPKPLQPQDVARAVRFILEQPRTVRIPRLMITPADQPL
ncbi:MAG: SDR family oxidoreductase [FCB group bacterium]|jgi:NADP-dependent 3-hydroxy acid dehydrogenase YdfG|nr:SDR family oxidoreductase [FCB group bacterium]